MGLIKDAWVESTLHGIGLCTQDNSVEESRMIALESKKPCDEEHLTLATHA